MKMIPTCGGTRWGCGRRATCASAATCCDVCMTAISLSTMPTRGLFRCPQIPAGRPSWACCSGLLSILCGADGATWCADRRELGAFQCRAGLLGPRPAQTWHAAGPSQYIRWHHERVPLPPPYIINVHSSETIFHPLSSQHICEHAPTPLYTDMQEQKPLPLHICMHTYEIRREDKRAPLGSRLHAQLCGKGAAGLHGTQTYFKTGVRGTWAYFKTGTCMRAPSLQRSCPTVRTVHTYSHHAVQGYMCVVPACASSGENE